MLDNGSHTMKVFFILLLVVSIVFPIYSFVTTMGDFAHNQWRMRQDRLQRTTPETSSSAHLGLTAAQLTGLGDLVADAYKDSVYDGYRLGGGYTSLWFESMALDGLLFITSLGGLSVCRRAARLTKRLESDANA